MARGPGRLQSAHQSCREATPRYSAAVRLQCVETRIVSPSPHLIIIIITIIIIIIVIKHLRHSQEKKIINKE